MEIKIYEQSKTQMVKKNIYVHAYPASKRSEVPDHLARRATCTFLGRRVSAETEENPPQRRRLMQTAVVISTQNPDLRRVSIDGGM